MTAQHEEPEHVWVPNGDGDEVLELATFNMPLPSDMGGDGWSLEVSESEPVTLHWGNGDYGIHLTRNSAGKRFGVEVNVLIVRDMSDVFEKLAQVVCEQVSDADDVKMRMEVTYY